MTTTTTATTTTTNSDDTADDNVAIVISQYDLSKKRFHILGKLSRNNLLNGFCDDVGIVTTAVTPIPPPTHTTTAFITTTTATTSTNNSARWTMGLEHGGTLSYIPKWIRDETCQAIRHEIDENQNMLRQYFMNSYQEKRVHVLLSDQVVEATTTTTGCNNDQTIHEEQQQQQETAASATPSSCSSSPQPGYQYHNVNMKARPLASMPNIATLSHDLAQTLHPVNESWGIGVDVLLYRDDHDKIGWHADDTQGETLIVSATIVSPTVPRQVIIRPKQDNLRHGDLQFTLYPRDGDVYIMDGEMQQSYEHCVPARANQVAASGLAATVVDDNRRYTLIFRDGQTKLIDRDTSSQANCAPSTHSTLKFGRLDNLCEGCLYDRRPLLNSGAHCSEMRGVSGNAVEGCNSVVVARQDETVAKLDLLFSFTYVANTSEGARALYKSYCEGKSIRVFRSSRASAVAMAATAATTGVATGAATLQPTTSSLFAPSPPLQKCRKVNAVGCSTISASTDEGGHYQPRAAAIRNVYRYDGLFIIEEVGVDDRIGTPAVTTTPTTTTTTTMRGNGKNAPQHHQQRANPLQPLLTPNIPYRFRLTRLPPSPCLLGNEYSNKEFLGLGLTMGTIHVTGVDGSAITSIDSLFEQCPKIELGLMQSDKCARALGTSRTRPKRAAAAAAAAGIGSCCQKWQATSIMVPNKSNAGRKRKQQQQPTTKKVTAPCPTK